MSGKLEGCAYYLDDWNDVWMFEYAGKPIVSISREHVYNAYLSMADIGLTELQVFKQLVAEWILSCMEGRGFDVQAKCLLTRYSECAI